MSSTIRKVRPKGGTYLANLGLTEDEIKRVLKYTQDEDVTILQYIRRAIRKYMDHEDGRH